MRVLYIYCHPLATSFHAAIRDEALKGLEGAGHEVDLLDLYAEGFDPVLNAEARQRYHDTSRNRLEVETYVARLQGAEAMVVQFPTWSFGLPAMLKGFFDRLFMPGVGFDISDPAHAKPLLGNIRKLVGISTYGRPRLMALYIGDPPRRTITRYVRWFIAKGAQVEYLALYHMNVATLDARKHFLAHVGRSMANF
jgi:NAD(P)H dehydrogenase (quinone)